jgi:hypothetical protein
LYRWLGISVSVAREVCSNEVRQRVVAAVAMRKRIAVVLAEVMGGSYCYGEWLLGEMTA